MTITHLSHYGLEICGQSSDSIIFSGTLSACKRMAAAHGMEIEKYEGCILGSAGGVATYALPNESQPNRILFVGGGMIQKCRDDYSLVMPLAIWQGQ